MTDTPDEAQTSFSKINTSRIAKCWTNKRTVGLAGFTLMLLGAFVFYNIALFRSAPNYPDIEGAFLPQARQLGQLSVSDQNDNEFTLDDFSGRWSLLGYGFTSCTDVCPVLLNKLVNVSHQIRQEKNVYPLDIVFYTVDPQRDTVASMRYYLGYFGPNIIGLIPSNKNPLTHSVLDNTAFEKSLGMSYQFVFDKQKSKMETEPDHYSVAHGMHLYLINPDAKLQAILRPVESNGAILQYLSSDIIADDVRRIIAFVENQ